MAIVGSSNVFDRAPALSASPSHRGRCPRGRVVVDRASSRARMTPPPPPYGVRTVHHLDDECPVERAGQRPGVQGSETRASGFGGVSEFPHYEHIIPIPESSGTDIEVDGSLSLFVSERTRAGSYGIGSRTPNRLAETLRERADRQLRPSSGSDRCSERWPPPRHVAVNSRSVL